MTTSPFLQFVFDFATYGAAVFIFVGILVNVMAKVFKR